MTIYMTRSELACFKTRPKNKERPLRSYSSSQYAILSYKLIAKEIRLLLNKLRRRRIFKGYAVLEDNEARSALCHTDTYHFRLN